MKRKLHKLLFSIALLCLSYSASAQVSRLFAVSDSNSNFYVLDTTDFSVVSQMPITLAGFTVDSAFGLARNPLTGVYYAIVAESIGTRLLVTINPYTGVATNKGNLVNNFETMTFAENGTLYGVTGITETLYKIDTANATSTPIGAIGEGMFGEGLAYSPTDDNLYYSTLDSINRTILKRIDTTAFDTTTFLVDSNAANIMAEPKGMVWMTNNKLLLETADGFFTLDTIGNATYLDSSDLYTGIAFFSCPILTITGTTSYCAGDSTLLTATTTPGTDTYQWYRNGAVIAGATDSVYYAKTPGIYNVLYSSQFCGPDSLATGKTLTEKPKPVADATPPAQTICSGATTSIAIFSNVGGTTFSWTVTTSSANITGASSGSGNSIAQTLSNSGTVDGTATYIITPTASGCIGTRDTAVVTVNPKIVVTLTSGNTTFCVGDSTLITGSAGGTNKWYRNGAVITGATSTTFYAKTAGIYNMLKTLNGCSDSATTGITITVNAKPVVTLTGNTLYCLGDSTQLSGSATNEATFQWYKNKTIIAGATAKTYYAKTDGIYNVRIVNTNGCADSAAVGKNVAAAFPAFTIKGNTVVCPGQSTQIEGPVGGTNQWYKDGSIINGATSSVYNATQTGVYNMLKTQNGCTDSAAVGLTLTTGCVNIVENTMAELITYPNPANDKITLKLPISGNDTYARMYNSLGQLVLERELSKTTEAILDVNNLEKGIYFITITNESKIVSTSKVVINR